MKIAVACGVLVTVSSVAASWVVSGFSRTQDQPQRPTFRTEANFVRVDAYPTIDGVPVGDLRQDEFAVFEDGTPQKIEKFEHIQVRGNVPAELRREPNSTREARSLLETTPGRVFVVFLDVGHVGIAGSHSIRQPLIDTLNRIIGPDDLVGVMTPDMSPTDVAFARRTTTIEGMLTRYWTWGEKGELPRDPVERMYEQCYPGVTVPCQDPSGKSVTYNDVGIAREMIARRREKFVFDAFEDLARFLGGAREERKAILVVSSGWPLFRPNPNLARQVRCEAPGIPQIGIDPRGGKLTMRPPNTLGLGNVPGSMYECDRDRTNLAQIDDAEQFRRLPDIANRANVSFYPINPQGLEVFDTPPDQPITNLAAEFARVTNRAEILKTLAENTDGTAIVNTNDLAGGMRRVVDDLSSYYLLGYYSTNTKTDGTFRRITVRVKRPNVQVRARRGYLAPTAAELNAASRTAAANEAATPGAAAEEALMATVLGPLAAYTRELPLRVQVAAGWKTDNTAAVWVVGEIAANPDWKAGGEADVMLAGPSGTTLSPAHASVALGSLTFRVVLPLKAPLEPGEYAVRVRARPAAGGIPLSDASRFVIARPAAPTGALFVRRGVSTGNRETPTADLRFRRGEQVRIEVPAPGAEPPSARLLDRTGKPLAVPVTAAVRDDADGTRWHTAQLALAPLAPGDYVIELAGGAGGEATRLLVAFRVVP